VIASKHPMPQWLTMDEAREHVRVGASRWDFASSDDDGDPDIVLVACGSIQTIELLATTMLLRREVPDLKVRFVVVSDLFTLATPGTHPSALSKADFEDLFTADKPAIFDFHGYASAVHQLLHRRPRQERFHVRGYAEEGTTTTPFELLAMNGVDRYQLAIEALSRVDTLAAESVRGMSGEFAVRSIPQAEQAIGKFKAELAAQRAYVVEEGNDPPEFLDWRWSTNGATAAG
jgi:xylulose-5-phosphate/fructose-6-phosphate phosphoketolase